jgi:hypothetical protein
MKKEKESSSSSRSNVKKESSSRTNVKKESSSRSVGKSDKRDKRDKDDGAPKKAEEMKVEELKASKDELEEEIKTLTARMDTLPTGKAGRAPREKIQARIREAKAEVAKFNKVDASFNFVGSSAPGCHVAFSLASGRLASSLSWVVDHHDYDPTEFAHLAEEPLEEEPSSKRSSKRRTSRRRSVRRNDSENSSDHSSADSQSGSGSSSSSSSKRHSRRSSSPDEDNHVPEINVDLETKLLSVYNTSKTLTKTFYISLLAPLTPAVDAHGEEFTMSSTRTPDGDEVENCLTFIIVVGPRRVVDLCYLASTSGLSAKSALRHSVKRGSKVVWPPLYSDVKVLKPHPNPAYFDDANVYRFPLERRVRRNSAGEDIVDPAARQGFLCSQGNNGCLSHFYPGTMHAIDLECPVGSRVVAVGRGVVTDIRQTSRAGGCHAANLFAWNSITLKLTNGVYVDYVHIATESAVVEVGQEVEAGELLCLSGDVGFCPRPHLHLQMHSSKHVNAPTTRFVFRGVSSDVVFLPEAGRWYDRDGQHEAPAHK